MSCLPIWIISLALPIQCAEVVQAELIEWLAPLPLASLATDVVVREPDVRKAYTSTFKGMNKIIKKYADTFSNCSSDTVLATTAMVIGGLAIARALDDLDLSERLLETCRANALRLLNDV